MEKRPRYYSLMVCKNGVWRGPVLGSYVEDKCKMQAFDYIQDGAKARIVESGDRPYEIKDAVAMFHLGTLPRPVAS